MRAETGPQPLFGPCAWRGDVLHRECRWQLHLDEQDHADLDRALAAAIALGASATSVSRDTFPLAGLATRLAGIADELERGCGVVRLRGLPPGRWSREELELVWMGLAGWLGTPVHQNANGQLLREIRNEGGDVGERYGQLEDEQGVFLSSRARTASSAALRFHTDRCDIVGLLCLSQAAEGGLSRMASSVAVHNAMLERAPRAAAMLYRNLPRSRIGEEQGGDRLWYSLPVWGVRDGKFTSHYSRTYVEAGQRQPGVPTVCDEYWQALDLLAEIADELCMEMRLEPGDIQFINNHVIYHARTAFDDDPATGRVRALLRVWLCAPRRALPPGHEVLWRAIEAGEMRGGIAQAETGH